MLFIVGLGLCAAIGVPLFALIGVAALMLFLDLPRGQASAAAIDVFGNRFAENYSLAAIPLFVFAGQLLLASQAPRRLVALAAAWLGPWPGGLALACVLVSATLAAFGGGSGLALAALGGLLLPALLAEQHGEPLSLGLITSSGAPGVLLPPSLSLLLYGVVAQVYLDQLLRVGLLAGLLAVALFAVYAAWRAVKAGASHPAFDRPRALAALRAAGWELAVPLALLGGLLQGLLRMHEAAAIIAAYVLVVEVFIKREITLARDVPRIAIESMILVGAVLMVLVAAIGWNSYMSQAGVPDQLLELLRALSSSRGVLLLVSALLIGASMLLGSCAVIALGVPLLLPVAEAYGVGRHTLAVTFLLSVEIGCLLPPLGRNLQLASDRYGRPPDQVYRAALPFIALLSTMLLIAVFLV